MRKHEARSARLRCCVAAPPVGVAIHGQLGGHGTGVRQGGERLSGRDIPPLAANLRPRPPKAVTFFPHPL